jgi:succinyl-diaminopimelate desuccinylase
MSTVDALDQLDGPSRDLVAFARRLVATPSLSGEEHAVSALLAAELERLGYRDIEVDEAGNVVGWLGEGPPRLMFNGHIDHVPPAGMDDPYGAQLVDGERFGERGLAIRGRGSCDMKANVAAGAYAAAFLDPAGLRDGSYLFTADVQEEPDSPAGVPALLARGLRAEYGLSGESTALDLSLGHRGKVQFDVVVRGRSSHASTPADGVNAVYRAVPFLQAIEALQADLPDDELFGGATIAVTGISSEPTGDVAVVPSACTIRVDRRYVPGETPDGVQRQLEALVAATASAHGTAAEVRRVNVYPLMEIGEGHELVRLGAAAIEAVTGRAPRRKTWRFGVNATFMAQAGIPTIGIGPGDENWAHTPEEHVPVGELVQASRVYAGLIERLCGGSEGVSR